MKKYNESFADAIRAHGMNPPIAMTSGEFYRFPGAGKKENNKAGWAMLFLGGSAGVYGDFSTGLSESWREKHDLAMTKSELDEFMRQVKKVRQEAEKTKLSEQAAAAKRAKEIWEKAIPAKDDHSYLVRKCVKPFCLCQDKGGRLITPIQSIDGKIQSLQFINENGDKRFLRNGRIDSCFFFIEDDLTSDETICIAEGFATAASIHEATGYLVAVAFNAGNLKAVAEAIREMYPETKIIICADDDYQTNGNPGATKATEAAIAIGGWLATPDFGPARPEGSTDFNDLHQIQGLETVRNSIESAVQPLNIFEVATPNEKNIDEEVTIQRLAALSPIEYDRARPGEAKVLGVRPATLDKMVATARKDKDTVTGLIFDEIKPWNAPVDPAKLLSDISATILRFIVCTKETADTAALWIAKTWFIKEIRVAPLAVITAPEKRCGKSLFLFLLGRLVARPLTASGISSAALYRTVEKWQPTLLIDEADSFMKENEEMRGLLNCGHTREGAYIIRVVGDNHEPTRFCTWGSKALAGIGKMADTIMDRAVVLELRRKLPHEQVERLRYAAPDLFENLASKLCRFANDHREDIRNARPDLPRVSSENHL